MTSAELTYAAPSQDLPLRKPLASPQPPSTPPLPTPATETALDTTVTSVLDTVVKDAVFEASVSAEKENVQRIITDLVTRVRTEAAPSQPPVQQGVPYADHRPRALTPDSPVSWTQTLDSVTVSLVVPEWVRKHHISLSLKSSQLTASVVQDGQQHLAVSGELVAPVDVDGCIWSLEGAHSARVLTIELEKAREQWWARLFLSDNAAQYTIVEPLRKGDRADAHVAPGPLISEPDNEEAEGDGDVELEEQVEEGGQFGSDGESCHDESPEDASDGLERTVSSVVREVLESVTSKSPSQGPEEGPGAGTGEASVSEKEPNRVARKVMTRADLPKMVEQYKATMKKGGPGSSEAALQLATFYHHGIGVDQNDAQAAVLYKHALESGALDASAAFQLGLIYNQGADGLEPNASEAVRWWQVSAGLGNGVAMFNLGVMLMNGSGCDMDPAAALRWFQQAQRVNPQLRTPQFSSGQLEDRMATAAKLKKKRMKEMLPPKERLRKREEALMVAKQIGYGSVAIVGLGISVVAIRYWWRNRL